MVPRLVGAGALGVSAVVMAACGHLHTLVVTHDGALWACGRGLHGELGLHENGPRHAFERVETGEFAGVKDGGGRSWLLALGGSDGGRSALDLGSKRGRAIGPRRPAAPAGADPGGNGEGRGREDRVAAGRCRRGTR